MEIYLHIPFCVKKCDYCDFLSFAGCEDGRQQAYLQALYREMTSAASSDREEAVTSVFIGGGTPSSLREGRIEELMAQLRRCFSLTEDCEITIEANPGTLTEGKLAEYRQAGINRLSLGLQSADNRELKLLGRIHSFEEFLSQYELARRMGFVNINIDLISAIPEQTIKNWKNNLDIVTGLEPEHISAYSLIIEEGTPFASRNLSLPSEEEERAMYELTGEVLQSRGYGQYEISNYAKEGYACRHNIGYWRRTDYLGFGLGAASLRNHVRYSNTSDMETYLKLSHDLAAIRCEREELTMQEEQEEFVFLGLRMREGISKAAFARCFGQQIDAVYGKGIEKMKALGFLEEEKGWLRLTREGISLSNQVFVEILM